MIYAICILYSCVYIFGAIYELPILVGYNKLQSLAVSTLGIPINQVHPGAIYYHSFFKNIDKAMCMHYAICERLHST